MRDPDGGARGRTATSPSPPDAPDLDRELAIDEVARTGQTVTDAVEGAIAGKHEAVRRALAVLLAQGHLLIEDVPGVGKTMLAKAMASAMGCTMHRIQFTPDLMPSDLSGVGIFNQRTQAFEFRPGGLFANIVLGDEINRASPKTQSAMLEAMEEHQVSVDGTSHRLPDPFLVIATQNPLEMEGTYSLPEAQRDRFMARLSLGYPDPGSEMAMIDRHGRPGGADGVPTVIGPGDVRRLSAAVRTVYLSPAVKQYVVDLVRTTRSTPDLRLGASPRASLHLVRASRAQAALDGRDHVLPDDVRELATSVLAHRLLRSTEARLADRSVEQVVATVLAETPVPRVSR